MPWPTTPPCAVTTCCPRSAATCSPASTSPRQPGPNSSAPPPSPPMSPSEPTCCAARPPASAGLDARVSAVKSPLIADVRDLEPRRREHRLKQPPEGAVLGANVLGVVGGGVPLGRVGRRRGEPLGEY